MPRGDRTGPEGRGPRTGRAAGYCAGYPAPGYANPSFGLGRRGGGRGRGNRRRNWFYATGLPRWARFAPDAADQGPAAPAADQEAEGLKAQAEWLKEQLDAVNRRLEELG